MVIGKIVELDPASIDVFNKFGMDAHQLAHLEFDEACKQRSADGSVIKQELLHLARQRRVNGNSFSTVVNTILKRHHQLKQKASQVCEFIDKALELEGSHAYELLTIRTKFNLLMEMLEVHQYKEEVMLFPEFVQRWRKFAGVTADNSFSFHLNYPIERLREEHELLSGMITEIQQLRQYYADAFSDPQNKNAVNDALLDFECGLNMLIQLEDTILFPKTLDMDTEVQNGE